MDNESQANDPDLPQGESLLWEGRPEVFRWSQGDATYLWTLAAAYVVPALILGLITMFLLGPFLWPQARNDELVWWGLFVSIGYDVALAFVTLLMRNQMRRGSTRYLITDQSIVLIKPYGEYFSIKLRKEKYTFRSTAIRHRQKIGSPGRWNLILGKERHFYEGNWIRSSKEHWITLGIKECAEAEKAESILEAIYGPGAGNPLDYRFDPVAQHRESDLSHPIVLDGPNRSSVLFIRGRNAPMVSWFTPKIPVTYAGKTDEEILENLLGTSEVVLWTGRPDYEPFQELGRFQKVAALCGLTLSPLFVWLGIQVWNLRNSSLLIVLGVGLVMWADAILFGRWSLRKIIGRAFYAITDRRVILVHPFGPDLFPFDQPFYSLDQASIAKRILCESPMGPAIIFQSKETISSNDFHHVENLGIVACPDWANAELILQNHFPVADAIEAVSSSSPE